MFIIINSIDFQFKLFILLILLLVYILYNHIFYFILLIYMNEHWGLLKALVVLSVTDALYFNAHMVIILVK